MEEPYHSFTGCQSGCINYEQFKWVVCFDSEKEKAEMDRTVMVDDIIANFLSWSCGEVEIVLIHKHKLRYEGMKFHGICTSLLNGSG